MTDETDRKSKREWRLVAVGAAYIGGVMIGLGIAPDGSDCERFIWFFCGLISAVGAILTTVVMEDEA